MRAPIVPIPALNLLFALALVGIVVVIYVFWSLRAKHVMYATARMLLQLVLIGYVLTFIFESESPLVVTGVLSAMLAMAAWIALRPIRRKRTKLYGRVLVAISAGGVSSLAVVSQVVIVLDPWFEPQRIIPLAGMVFANAMNAVSLSAERFEREREQGHDYVSARATAFSAAMIPLTNSFFAVGLVSLPGMMTGQILSGISPLIAVRYQIMVMCMVFGSAGISAATYLALLKSIIRREEVVD